MSAKPARRDPVAREITREAQETRPAEPVSGLDYGREIELPSAPAAAPASRLPAATSGPAPAQPAARRPMPSMTESMPAEDGGPTAVVTGEVVASAAILLRNDAAVSGRAAGQ